MTKLFHIISEIKIIGKVTPEQVYELFSEIWTLLEFGKFDLENEEWEENEDLEEIIVNILDEYNIDTDEDIRAYENLSQIQLRQLYLELQEFKQKHNL